MANLFLQVADAQADDGAAADALFNKAKKHLDAGEFALACPALAESQRLEPKPGTLYALADCEFTLGTLADSLAHYAEYLRLYDAMTGATRSRHTPRAKVASEQVKKLDVRVPRISLVWKGQVPRGLEISHDGAKFGSASLGVALPMNPGVHVFVVEIPGQQPSEHKITLEPGDKKTLELESTTNDAPASVSTNPPPQPPSVDSAGTHPLKIVGGIAVGIGGLGLAAGALTGSLALKEKTTIDAHCNGAFLCDADGIASVGRVRTYATLSNATFIGGGVVAAAGIVMLIVAPKSRKAQETSNAHLMGSATKDSAYFGIEGTFQ